MITSVLVMIALITITTGKTVGGKMMYREVCRMTDELISKKSLLKEIDEVIAQYNWKEYVILDILHCARDMVFDQPTVYDIDKVIEQLEETFDKWGLDDDKKATMREMVKRGGEQE